MRRQAFKNCNYSVCLPNGVFLASQKNGKITTDRGEIIFPYGEPLQPDMWYDGRIVCSTQDDTVRELVNGSWEVRGSSFAPEGWVYDNHGQVRINRYGIRYFNEQDQLVSCESTYIDLPFCEWTQRGDIRVGHGSDGLHDGDPIIIQHAGSVRVLEPGIGRFVRFRRAGNDLAISFTNAATDEAVHYWLTVSEIAQLPLLQNRVPTPTPPPAPAPQPPPVEEPKMELPNDFDVIRAVNDAHPGLVEQNSRESCTEFIWRAVWALHQKDERWGFLGKSAAENHVTIAGKRVSIDAIAYNGLKPIVDILKSAGDGPGTGGIGWGVDEHRRESNEWVEPVAFPGSAPTPIPTPEPEKPTDVAARLEELRGEVVELRRSVTELRAVVEQLRSKPFPSLRAKGKHRLGWSRDQDINIPVILSDE